MKWLEQQLGRLARFFRRHDRKPHGIGILADIEREESAALLFPPDHLADPLDRLRCVGQRQPQIVAMVLPKRIAVEGARMTKTALAYVGAAFAEIAGCFAVWAWLRLDKSAWWIAPGLASLALFAWLLTLVDSDLAGRAYATYGGVYIGASLVWLWAAEGSRPDRWDAIGALVCLVGAATILFGPRAA